MTTGIYAAMHFMVDMVCAWSMYGLLRDSGADGFLIYNFCAFALQLPLGTLLDLLGRRHGRIAALTGCGLTLIGAVTHPAVLGLGNALFHVGGGLETIAGDFARDRGGRDLGLFVAPGALGLYLGGQLGKSLGWLPVFAVLLAGLSFLLSRRPAVFYTPPGEEKGNGRILCLCCFLVVILRSFVGLSVSFPWKTGPVLGFLAVAAVASGKAAGGFLQAVFGPDRTIFCSLGLAAICFLLGNGTVFGLAALLLFNMSMPVTLYLLARKMRTLPGFSFGLLTFGLFLGFWPVHEGWTLTLSGPVLGALGSALSLVLLALGRKAVDRVRI